MNDAISTNAEREKTPGEVYEGIAFTFCKAATLILLTGHFALPVAAGGAAIFYALTYRAGKNDTRCVFKKPLFIAALWGVVSVVSLFLILRPLWKN